MLDSLALRCRLKKPAPLIYSATFLLRVNEDRSIYYNALISRYSYLYPAEHDFITMRNDKTLYRIQSRRYWISEMKGPDDIDYGESTDIPDYLVDMMMSVVKQDNVEILT